MKLIPITLLALGSTVANPIQNQDFDCHPKQVYNNFMDGQSCMVQFIQGTTYRASCGTTGFLDFSPGSGVKNGRIQISNKAPGTVQYWYLYAQDGHRHVYAKNLTGDSSCKWELPPGQVIGQVSFLSNRN